MTGVASCSSYMLQWELFLPLGSVLSEGSGYVLGGQASSRDFCGHFLVTCRLDWSAYVIASPHPGAKRAHHDKGSLLELGLVCASRRIREPGSGLGTARLLRRRDVALHPFNQGAQERERERKRE